MRIPFSQIDAFATTPFTGNPAAVMPLSAWLPDDVLQRIAAENNLSETAFLLPDATGEADFELRWFTPDHEVRLCGHATLASGHFVLSSGSDASQVRFRTRRAGVLTVTRDGSGYALALPAWKPDPKPLPQVVAALGVTDVVETLWREGGYGVIVLGSEAAVRAVQPDLRALAKTGDHQAIVTARGDTAQVVTRMFAPGAGVDEDPVTGSAHAVIVPYWAEKLGTDRFTAFQASRRGGALTCTLEGNRVVLGGGCVTVIEGTFLLP
ncbi:PhzF family phenazine biosynthesis protein [Sphingomonas sp. RP10(2022)]|uniref:PhzF family phenazine biosynthesis protein n=1 Tax=Sphingomonas liriopis TaxID=2949094 RepID=A0A9X2HR58_9SPHN|nr:PhzF family phenazine biosynthesis protein [Sphingomonas liriopis]MCP3734347.1 PhzF family phenazine biosynthesis protein [Sphingomonas liriopis]